MLRLPPSLHTQLRSLAGEAGLSLNEYCRRRLEEPAPPPPENSPAGAVLARAAAIAGDALVGVVAYGSWARGTAMATSDVDVLVAIDSRMPLTRDLYRQWDGAPVSWEGRVVDPHFVHVPTGDLAGVWGEAALDGLVLYERDWQLSIALARLRRDIADGRLVRRVVHGQPYWTRAA